MDPYDEERLAKAVAEDRPKLVIAARTVIQGLREVDKQFVTQYLLCCARAAEMSGAPYRDLHMAAVALLSAAYAGLLEVKE